MSATLDIDRIGYSSEVFEDFLKSRSEPDWIIDARRTAYAKYEELLGEELDPEEFKRVDLRIFNAAKFRPSEAASNADSIQTLLANETEYGGQIAHVDGHSGTATLADSIAEQGVLFGDLQTLLTENRETLEPYFLQQAVRPDADRFAAWHAAFWTSGTLLYVPKGVTVDLPLHSLIAHTTEGVADFGHTLIIVEDEARATLLDQGFFVHSQISCLPGTPASKSRHNFSRNLLLIVSFHAAAINSGGFARPFLIDNLTTRVKLRSVLPTNWKPSENQTDLLRWSQLPQDESSHFTL